MQGLVKQNQEEKVRLNRELFEAAKKNEKERAFALIRQGAVVDQDYRYAISLVGEKIFAEL